VKDNPGLKIPGVYGIPCECGKMYIGQTNRTIETRRKEHMQHLRLGQPDKSAVAQQALETGHKVKFNNTCRLARRKEYMDHIIKEAIEIKLHPDNINRDGGYILSRAWQPVLRQIGTLQQGLRTQQYKQPTH
jgi:predicted GIY-YIG superfamily endonuclease